jgi:hypothetical protein
MLRSLLSLWLMAALVGLVAVGNVAILRQSGMPWGVGCFALGILLAICEFGLFDQFRAKSVPPEVSGASNLQTILQQIQALPANERAELAEKLVDRIKQSMLPP